MTRDEKLKETINNVVKRIDGMTTGPDISPELAAVCAANPQLMLYIQTWIAGPLLLAVSDNPHQRDSGLSMSR